MKILIKLIAAFIALALPVIIFQSGSWGIDIVEHRKWIVFAHIPFTAIIFAAAVNWGIADMFKPFKVGYWDEGTKRFRKTINPFWGWYILSVIIEIVIAFLME